MTMGGKAMMSHGIEMARRRKMDMPMKSRPLEGGDDHRTQLGSRLSFRLGSDG